MGTETGRHNIHKICKPLSVEVATICKNTQYESKKYPTVFYSMFRLSLNHNA
jgi:hypothetical protein